MAGNSKNGPGAQAKEQAAANQAGEAGRGKEKNARQANAEKQRRYRKSMKAKGYKARLVWEKPLDAGLVRVEAPVISESSLNAAATGPAIKAVLDALSGTFIIESKRRGIPEETWRPVYRDFLTLLKPLGVEG
jgi:hypothetical protein